MKKEGEGENKPTTLRVMDFLGGEII